MTTYLIFLRGVMPTGKNKVPMAQLREVLTKAKFKNVQTYIHTGNIVLESKFKAKSLEKKVHDLIQKQIGPDLVVVAKTPTQVQKILKENPFKKEDASRIFYTMLAQKPSPAKIKEVTQTNFLPEKIQFKGDVAYAYIPESNAKSKINNNGLEKLLGVSSTARNVNTMKKLLEMSLK